MNIKREPISFHVGEAEFSKDMSRLKRMKIEQLKSVLWI